MMVYIVRVYPNGTAKHTRREGDQSSYFVYNKESRPGCAVFADGECVQAGGLEMEQLILVGKAIKAEIERNDHLRVPIDSVGPQVETYGGIIDRWTGYCPERHRDRFF